MSIYDQMNDLVTCLCAQVEIDGSPAFCFCGVLPGAETALEYIGECDDDVCGMAFVRLSTAYPASGVGQQNTNPKNCDAGMGYDVVMGAIRCLPVGTEDGSPPTRQQMAEATEQQLKDLMSMWRAVRCCLPTTMDYIVGQYQPLGPDGGVVGGQIEINFLLD